MKKIYIVPNIVTTANMFCGFYSIIASIQQNYVGAAWAIVAAAVFDMLDGRIARLAKATSLFGVEYDSLSDLVSFGLAPSILLYKWQLEPYGRPGIFAAFFYTACGALRLARFNINTSLIPKSYFQGLPIPVAAGMIATYLLFVESIDFQFLNWNLPHAEIAIAFSLGLASLMVSTIRFPSMKEFHWKSKASFGYLLIGVLMMILIAVKPEVALFFVILSYISFSLVWNFFRVLFEKKTTQLTNISHEHRSHGQGD